jgi:hypothetical protein
VGLTVTLGLTVDCDTVTVDCDTVTVDCDTVYNLLEAGDLCENTPLTGEDCYQSVQGDLADASHTTEAAVDR